ncbi:MAG: SPFH domain-containing protein [Gammaproteobacteria bacterium]
MSIEEPPNDQDPWGDPRHRSELDIWLIRLKGFLVKSMKRPRSGGLRRRHRWQQSLPWAILLIAGVWLATGFGTLAPGEVALLYVLGQPIGRATNGNFWNWPRPLGRTRILDLSAPHSHFVTFRTLTEEDRPIAVTVRYVYKITRPEAYQLFAKHPALWLRGLILSRLGAWVRLEPHPIRSAKDPDRPLTQPPLALIRKKLNRSLSEIHSGLRLVELTASLDPPSEVRKAVRTWFALRLSQKHTIAEAKETFKQSYRAQKLAEQNKRLAIKIRIRRWIERARLQTARFLSILSAYRLHPVLVRQWLVSSFLRRLKRIPKIMGSHEAGALLWPLGNASIRKNKTKPPPHPGSGHPAVLGGVKP